MKRSRRELFIEMVIHSDIFKNNQITLLHCFTFIYKTGISFYCVDENVGSITLGVTQKWEIRLSKLKVKGNFKHK